MNKRIFWVVLMDIVTILFIVPLSFTHISVWSPWLIIPIVLYINFRILTKKEKK